MYGDDMERADVEEGLAAFMMDLDVEEQNMRDAGNGAGNDSD